VTPPHAGWLDVRASAELVGALVALELSLHGRMGALTTDVEEPALCSYLAMASMAHARRAALLEELLPVSVGLPERGELVVLRPDEPALAGDLVPDESLLPTLLARVYPELLARYEDAAAVGAMWPASDGPLLLAAQRAATDVKRVVTEGVELRRSLYEGDRTPSVAAELSPRSGRRSGGLTPSIH
jgi:hypothetical protein